MKKNRFPHKLFWLSLCVCSVALLTVNWTHPVSARQDAREQMQADVSRAFESFDALELDPVLALKIVRQEKLLSLQTSRGLLELELEPFDVRAENWRGVMVVEGGVVKNMERTPANTYRGIVRGEPGSGAALIMDGAKVEGVILMAGETYFIESAKPYSEAAGKQDFIFYSESAVKEEAGECGVTLAEEVAAESARVGAEVESWKTQASAKNDPKPEEAYAPNLLLELATEADFEYYQAFGSSQAAAQNEINGIVSAVSEIYRVQLGIQISIVFSRVWATPNDPYTQTNASPALNELSNVYNGSFAPGPAPARDLVHMWTGKDLDGSTIGIAFSSVVCDAPEASYGISQKFDSVPQKNVLTAHEIGHNFSAQHPDQVGAGGDCGFSVMNSSITASTNFCQFSRDQITNHTNIVNTGSTACLARLTQPGCIYALSTTSSAFGIQGGTATIGVSTGAGCSWDVAEGASWLTVNSGAPNNGPGSFNLTASPNTGGPRSAVVDVGGQRLGVHQAASPNCGATLINMGQTLSGDLSAGDCRAGQADRPNAAVDIYAFAGRAGQRIRIEMNAAASSLDTYLYLYGPDGMLIAENDDIVLGQQTNSRIPVNGFFPLPATGIYTIAATSFNNNATGGYTLRLSDNSATNSVSFSSASYVVNEAPGANGIGVEGAGFVTVTVNRSGDTSGTALVNYALSNGTADHRRDYSQALGTLVFAPGQTSKTFRVQVTDDVFAPGSMIGGNVVESAAETINLTLSAPTGTTLGAPSNAVVTINSNDLTAGQPSPVRWDNAFNSTFFVRQHYLDFLGREPDAGGLAFWRDQIESCGADVQCREVRRVNVSAAFYLSIEFQETGYLVYRFYKAAYGDTSSPNVAVSVPVIRHSEFLADSARIGDGVVVGIGNWQAQLEANKAAYAEEFVITPRFLAAYPLTMTPAQFVDTLNQRSGGALSQAERDLLVSQLQSGAKTRGAVVRAVAEDQTLAGAEFRRAFVLMQYYGYMRRNPDDPQDTDFRGWEFWLDQLNHFNGNFEQAEMVKAFITSIEYTERFGH